MNELRKKNKIKYTKKWYKMKEGRNFDDAVELRMYNYSDGTEIGAKIDDLQARTFNLYNRLFDRKENINLMREEIGDFLLEVSNCRK